MEGDPGSPDEGSPGSLDEAGEVDFCVSCDESGHTKFPFSYCTYVTSLTPAQGRLRIGSVLYGSQESKALRANTTIYYT